MADIDIVKRIERSWAIRRNLIDRILSRGNILIEALKLVPESRSEMTSNRWKAIVEEELEKATKLYGNGEPLLSENELLTLSLITYPGRGW